MERRHRHHTHTTTCHTYKATCNYDDAECRARATHTRHDTTRPNAARSGPCTHRMACRPPPVSLRLPPTQARERRHQSHPTLPVPHPHHWPPPPSTLLLQQRVGSAQRVGEWVGGWLGGGVADRKKLHGEVEGILTLPPSVRAVRGGLLAGAATMSNGGLDAIVVVTVLSPGGGRRASADAGGGASRAHSPVVAAGGENESGESPVGLQHGALSRLPCGALCVVCCAVCVAAVVASLRARVRVCVGSALRLWPMRCRSYLRPPPPTHTPRNPW